ncbi:hypothetical protein C8R42DRAFT_729760 [Lentinula raphanica]|nr:hypothetical protein C8R42DRAFT_729760 [Lentinula raphanica]
MSYMVGGGLSFSPNQAHNDSPRTPSVQRSSGSRSNSTDPEGLNTVLRDHVHLGIHFHSPTSIHQFLKGPSTPSSNPYTLCCLRSQRGSVFQTGINDHTRFLLLDPIDSTEQAEQNHTLVLVRIVCRTSFLSNTLHTQTFIQLHSLDPLSDPVENRANVDNTDHNPSLLHPPALDQSFHRPLPRLHTNVCQPSFHIRISFQFLSSDEGAAISTKITRHLRLSTIALGVAR